MAQHNPKFLQLVEEARRHIRELQVDDVKTKLDHGDNFQLIDVREDHEWQASHLPCAHHLGRGILERDIEAKFPNPHTEIVLYCGGGFRSALAAFNLQKMGYTNVYSMDGGFRGWTEKNLPVEKQK